MKTLIPFLVLCFYSMTAWAQHEHHMPPADHDKMDMGTDSMMTHDMDDMHHAFSLHAPMSRNGSGTSWLPDAAPMYGNMFHTQHWMYMLHYNFFLRYNNQDFSEEGNRGDSQFDMPNWLMFMGQRNVGTNGLFHFSTMLSLDPLTVGENGYPLLFQSGETYQGLPLVDRQHPHDLFSELSVSYSHAFSQHSDFFIYLGYPGEPALGPVAFMHRPSAMPNPDAPLGHHWMDATHITYGVATLGLRLRKVKLEVSSFTGREPDEDRYDFDKPKFDSWSGRISLNPALNWALQASHGFLKSPEWLHPETDVYRSTISTIYSLPIDHDGSLDITAAWGQNKVKGEQAENAALLEGAWRSYDLLLHARYEFVQKSKEELNLDDEVIETLFPIHAFTAGLNYNLFHTTAFTIAGGGQFTMYVPGKNLEPVYGKSPKAFEIYLRFYPPVVK